MKFELTRKESKVLVQIIASYRRELKDEILSSIRNKIKNQYASQYEKYKDSISEDEYLNRVNIVGSNFCRNCD